MTGKQKKRILKKPGMRIKKKFWAALFMLVVFDMAFAVPTAAGAGLL